MVINRFMEKLPGGDSIGPDHGDAVGCTIDGGQEVKTEVRVEKNRNAE